MPTYTHTANVIGHKTDAIILRTRPLFLKNSTERIMVESIALNPKPPKQPKSKNDCHLLSFINGCCYATRPYITNPDIKTPNVQIKYSIRFFLVILCPPLQC